MGIECTKQVMEQNHASNRVQPLLGADHDGNDTADAQHSGDCNHSALVAAVCAAEEADDESTKISAQIRHRVDDSDSRPGTVLGEFGWQCPETSAHALCVERSNTHADTDTHG